MLTSALQRTKHPVHIHALHRLHTAGKTEKSVVTSSRGIFGKVCLCFDIRVLIVASLLGT